MELDQWQKDVINDNSKYLLVCKGRQIGGTTTFAEKAAERMLFKKTRILVGSITEDQAQLVILMVYEILMKKNPRMVIQKGKDKTTKDFIALTNGSQIRSRPVGTRGDSFRGFTADIAWLNEAAAWPELALIAIMPTLLTTGGEIWADSTPKGKYLPNGEKRWFYKAFTSGKWKVYYKSSLDVIQNREIKGDWTEERRLEMLDFLRQQKEEMPELEFGQEYLGLFQEELLQFFDEELIEMLSNQVIDTPNYNEEYYLGADIGGMGKDPTIIAVGRKTNDKLYQTDMVKMKQKYTTEVSNKIKELKRYWNTKKEYIDGAGIGFGVYSELHMDDETKNSVEDINKSRRSTNKDGTQKTKILESDLYWNLKVLMENKKVFFLDNDELRASLRGIQRHVDENGKEHFSGRNNHITEALVRLGWCMQTKDLKLNVYSIKV